MFQRCCLSSYELLDWNIDNFFRILLSKIIFFVLNLGRVYGEKTNVNKSEGDNMRGSLVFWFTNTDVESENNCILFK
jgi:hypothetical protein